MNKEEFELSFDLNKEEIIYILLENLSLKDYTKATKFIADLEQENQILNDKLGQYIENKQEWIELLNKFKTQQKEFIKYLEKIITTMQNDQAFRFNHSTQYQISIAKNILTKYKQIIGDENE